MSNTLPLPRPVEPFLIFTALLRANGFAVAQEQTTSLLSAIELLGPRSIEDIRRAAFATLAPPAERHAEFDALFRAHFLGEFVPGIEPADSDEEPVNVRDDRRGHEEALLSDEVNEAGQAATSAEALSVRRLRHDDEQEALRQFARKAPTALPRMRGYRLRSSRRGGAFDIRRSLRQALRNDGEVMRLPRLERRWRQRRVLLLIDVSGSMKTRTDAHLRFAHALTRAADRIEVFTFGTRLTRITRALRLRHREQALDLASTLVSDWDGGTRIGDALQAFLAVPRFAGFARGALTIILSDGLERGDPAAMRDAVARLSRRAWRIVWLTPLAAAPGFKPETEALKAILPFIDELGDGGSTEALTRQVMALGRQAKVRKIA